MSTKCSVMCKTSKTIDYHFYYDYVDGKYHLDSKDIWSYNEFLQRIGKILEQCPLSDAGVYLINLTGGKSSVTKNKTCGLLERRK